MAVVFPIVFMINSAYTRREEALIKKFSKDYILKYLPQMNLRKISVEGQKKISNSKIIIIGLGGIGTPFLTYIIRSGISSIGIVEYSPAKL